MSRTFFCAYPYCANPQSPLAARGLCLACYHMLYRDRKPAGKRALARARERARRSWRRRRQAALEAAREIQERALREAAWRIARLLMWLGAAMP